MCVSGVGGVLGRRVLSRAAVESGSATGSPWPLLQDPSVGAKRPRPKDATRPSAQVHVRLKREQSQQTLNIRPDGSRYVSKITVVTQFVDIYVR